MTIDDQLLKIYGHTGNIIKNQLWSSITDQVENSLYNRVSSCIVWDGISSFETSLYETYRGVKGHIGSELFDFLKGFHCDTYEPVA